MDIHLAIERHIKYLKRHLALLPSSHQDHDVNKMSIIFYSLVSLSSLGVDVVKEYGSNAKWIRKHYITINPSDSDKSLSGFIGSLSMNAMDTHIISLPNTLFALLTLKILKDDEFFDKILDKDSLCAFVASCQISQTGAFASALDYKKVVPSFIDASDTRFCFIAVEILFLLGCRKFQDFTTFIDAEKLVSFILSQQCSVGAFGMYDEPHAGYTSCALSALKILGKIDCLNSRFKNSTILWLVHRQVSGDGSMALQNRNPCYDKDDDGGFQGRENKFADTCYAFWCLNSYNILKSDNGDRLDLFEPTRLYLLERTQNELIGGFSKNDVDDPDLYHTCLGIAALKLMEGTFDGVLFMPKNVMV